MPDLRGWSRKDQFAVRYDLEQQTRPQHAAGQRAALMQAQQQLASARETAVRLQQQLNDNKRATQEFAARLNEYKAMQEDLAHLEQLHRAATEQLAKREAREAEDAPRGADIGGRDRARGTGLPSLAPRCDRRRGIADPRTDRYPIR